MQLEIDALDPAGPEEHPGHPRVVVLPGMDDEGGISQFADERSELDDLGTGPEDDHDGAFRQRNGRSGL